MSSPATASAPARASARTFSSISISRAASPVPRLRSTMSTVVEIGPGPGGLTRALLMEGAKRVIAIEKDERALPALAEIAAAYPGRLEIDRGGCACVSTGQRLSGAKPRSWPICPTISPPPCSPAGSPGPGRRGSPRSRLMFQKEVAERIAARPGSARPMDGSRSCANGAAACASSFDVDRRAFTPPPNDHLRGRRSSSRADARSVLPSRHVSNGSRPPPSASAARCCARASRAHSCRTRQRCLRPRHRCQSARRTARRRRLLPHRSRRRGERTS